MQIEINASNYNISGSFTLLKPAEFNEIALMQPLHFDIDEPWIFDDFIQAFIYQIKTFGLQVQGHLDVGEHSYDFHKYYNALGGRNWGRIYSLDDGPN